MSTIRKILKSAEIKRSDILYDLGSGDGRIIIAAANEYGIKTVGIENNHLLYLISKWNVKRYSVSSKVKLIRGDLFRQNLSEANVVVVYLTQRMNDKLKPKLEKELRKGTRVVSADHVFKGWKEVSKIKTGHFYCHLYKI
ncbi:MAG: SAM-dependent methyltransferase [Candidatus Aenigmarchaeota archaeon]|nr:SAM-dependent methyltransferase [Candidatus Aenigmarchaeota archaeon]